MAKQSTKTHTKNIHQGLILGMMVLLMLGCMHSVTLSKQLSEKQFECLTRNVYFESGIEPDEGQMAVAFVTLNRVHSNVYPNTICKVVYQSEYENGQPKLNRCQFSWFCDNKPDKLHPALYAHVKRNTERAIKQYYSDDFVDPTDGALWFHGEYVRPYWASKVTKTVQIGRHIFYKRKD